MEVVFEVFAVKAYIEWGLLLTSINPAKFVLDGETLASAYYLLTKGVI